MALDATTAQSLQNIVDSVNRQTEVLQQQQEAGEGGTSTFKKETSSLQQYVRDLMTERKAAMSQVKTYLKNAEGLSKASEDLMGLTSESKDLQKTIARVRKEYQDLDLDTLNEATKEQIETMLTYAEQQQASTEDLMRLSQTMHEASLMQQADGVISKKITQERLGAKKVMEDMKDKTKETVNGFFTLNKSIALLTLGITRAILSMQEALKTQAPMMDATAMEWENWAARFGLSSTKFMATVDENSQMMLANAKAGSDLRSAAGQYLQVFDGMRSAAFRLTGDLDDASTLVASSFDVLSAQAVDLNFDELQQRADPLMKSLTSLAKVTNKTAEQNATALKVAMQDAGVRKSLLQLGKRERLDFVNKMAQDQLLLINKGMEADAALEAVKALKGIAGQDPKERLKEAARMAAQAGAMGVGGGQEMIQLAMKPVSQWTEEETARAQKFGTEMESAVAAGLGSSQFGVQASTFAIDALSQGPFKEAIMGLSTASTEGTAIADRTFEEAVKSNTILTGVQDILASINEAWQRTMAVISDIGVVIVGGLVVGLTALLSPVIGILAGIAAAIAAIGAVIAAFANWDTISDTIGGAVDSVGSFFGFGGDNANISDKADEVDQARKEREEERQRTHKIEQEIRDEQAQMLREQNELLKRSVELQEKGYSAQEATAKATMEGNQERKQLTQKQIDAQDAMRRQQHMDANLVPAGA